MFTNILMILIGGSLLLLMLYSFYLVLFSKPDKKTDLPANPNTRSERKKMKSKMAR